MKDAVKHALMKAYLASGFAPTCDSLFARFGVGRLTVLTYHQIKDPANDYSTVSPATFREQMQYLKQHYRVLHLREAVKVAAARGWSERVVAITFDDGYQDNATIAAPILRSLDLPACFFVATDMIGNRRPFPHDLFQGRPRQEHMTWQQVRALARDGFEIGSHTCSHVDLGVISTLQAERELHASRKRLELELDMPIRLFAFPYGHRRNMRPATIAAACREIRDVLLRLRWTQPLSGESRQRAPRRDLDRSELPRLSGAARGMADDATQQPLSGNGRGGGSPARLLISVDHHVRNCRNRHPRRTPPGRARSTAAHAGRADAPRPRRGGIARRRMGGARTPTLEHHRPRGGPAADVQRGRQYLDRLQRRDLQPPGPARRARGGGASLPHQVRHRDDRPRLRAVGRRLRRPFPRDVRVRDLGCASTPTTARPRSAGREAGLLDTLGWPSALRVGDQGDTRKRPRAS